MLQRMCLKKSLQVLRLGDYVLSYSQESAAGPENSCDLSAQSRQIGSMMQGLACINHIETGILDR